MILMNFTNIIFLSDAQQNKVNILWVFLYKDQKQAQIIDNNWYQNSGFFGGATLKNIRQDSEVLVIILFLRLGSSYTCVQFVKLIELDTHNLLYFSLHM
jgi:hypothetical protein